MVITMMLPEKNPKYYSFQQNKYSYQFAQPVFYGEILMIVSMWLRSVISIVCNLPLAKITILLHWLLFYIMWGIRRNTKTVFWIVKRGWWSIDTSANGCYPHWYERQRVLSPLIQAPTGVIPIDTNTNGCYPHWYKRQRVLSPLIQTPTAVIPIDTSVNGCYPHWYKRQRVLSPLIQVPTGVIPIDTNANGCYPHW